MTTSEKLAFVEAQIRKDIPRTMELREGCLLMKNEKHDNVLKAGEVVKISCLWNDIIQVSPIGEPLSRNYVECQINDLFEIIGHDIMLNDVLEWLNNKFYEKDYFITSKGIFGYRAVEYDIIETYILRGIKINLHSPYLKDQSEELINFLYNPIKE